MKRIFLLFLFIPILSFSQTYTGTIFRVIDGDTFVFQGEVGSLKIRMNGIDAPESDQPFGKESTEFLCKFSGDSCKIEIHGTDKYGRTIANLFIKGENINLKMVQNGMAWQYKKYSSDPELAEAEIKARKEHKGLWSQQNPTAPWEWRHLN